MITMEIKTKNLLTILFMAIIVIPFNQNAISQESVVFDQTVTWEWPIPKWYGGYSFYWWHRPLEGVGVTNFGEMSSTNWLSPANYRNGTFYMRFEVLSQPTSNPFRIQFGIWQDISKAGGHSETISGNVNLSGGTGSVTETNIGSPATWWQIRTDAPVDFTRPEDFYRIGIVLWKGNCVPKGSAWGSDGCPQYQAEFFPMQARITVVACASGTTFSGWENYTGGTTRQPTPSYTIDYANEQTSQTVPSTDEYAYSSNMSGAVSGTGVKLGLTPGTNVYFRTKAAGELLESLVQTLSVKARPSAPTFVYDPTNQRTSTTVSSAYEFSDNADMTGAVSGTGTNVSFAVGTTRYFRKKATSSDFKSSIQELTGVAKAPTPSYAIDYINETSTTVIPSTDEYSNSSNMSGAVNGAGAKLTLTPGTDVYFRTKASGEIEASDIQHLDVPSRQATPTFTYDATNHRTTQTVSSAYQYADNSAMTSAVTGTGAYVSFAVGTTKYFRKLATASAFKSNVQALTATSTSDPSNIGPEFVILNEIIEYPNVTDDNGFYFFYYNSTMPTNWLSSYDYYNGQIYTRYEILTQETSEPIALQFGIWQKLPVETGTLYENMETQRTLNGPGSVVTSNSKLSTFWKYNGGADFTQMDKVWHFGINPYKVNGPTSFTQIRSENAAVWATRNTYWFPMTVRVTVVAVANGYTFSGWNNYVGDGTYPAFGIDFTNEQTATAVLSTQEYSVDQNEWTSGTDAKLTLTPGEDIFFRRKNAPTYIQHLTVPPRPNQPAFAIDFINERTTAIVSSEYEYDDSSNMTAAQSGSNAVVKLTPGVDMYFRKKASETAFISGIQRLVVPARPAAPTITIDYVQEKTAEAIPNILHYSDQADFSITHEGVDSSVNVTPGEDLYFRIKATNNVFTSQSFKLASPGRPEITSQITSPATQSPIEVQVTFPGAVTGLESSDFMLINGTLTSITESNVASIIPLESGLVSVTLKANSVSPPNFSSVTFSITYSEVTAVDKFKAEDVKLYPTFSQSQIILECKSCNNDGYYVVDVHGRRVLSGNLTDIFTPINIEKLLPAAYQLILVKPERNITIRFIKLAN